MTATQPPEAQTRAASGRDKAAQRMKDLKRAAMRLAVYVRELGGEPAKLRGNAYCEWERALQKQYQQLRESLGKEAGQAARVRGRAVIRREGLSAAVADLLPGTKQTQREKGSGSNSVADQRLAQLAAAPLPMKASATLAQAAIVPNPLVCQRKYRHLNFLSAMLHARQIQSPGLHVYPCEFCDGLHIGHDPESEDTQRARTVRKRLRSIDKQLAGMERQAAELRRERQTLLAEQGVLTEAARDRLQQYLRRAGAWLRRS